MWHPNGTRTCNYRDLNYVFVKALKTTFNGTKPSLNYYTLLLILYGNTMGCPWKLLRYDTSNTRSVEAQAVNNQDQLWAWIPWKNMAKEVNDGKFHEFHVLQNGHIKHYINKFSFSYLPFREYYFRQRWVEES